jgi:hypothetical protein
LEAHFVFISAAPAVESSKENLVIFGAIFGGVLGLCVLATIIYARHRRSDGNVIPDLE